MAVIQEEVKKDLDIENKNLLNFAFIDENSKREIRRSILKAIAIPGYQVPFASRELPIARGWGTGGLQITMSIIGREDVIKVIDQGCDGVVNAVNLRNLLVKTTGVETTFATEEATIIQTRHRIPEKPMRDDQVLVLQVPYPEPLRRVEAREEISRQMHAEKDYSLAWLDLYERVVKWDEITIGAQYPVMVNDRYIMSPSPVPRWDLPMLDNSDTLYLFGAGREKRIYAVPPYTEVKPLEFEDYKFRVEEFKDQSCHRCGSTDSFFDEVYNAETGKKYYICSDSAYCEERMNSNDK
ncbi:MAG: alpha-D-ribose 1-methylphosphonate 5-phosphate C-P-lyase PhnJ [Halanaerobiaceae bacterium]